MTWATTTWYGTGIADGARDPATRQLALAGAAALVDAFDDRYGLIPAAAVPRSGFGARVGVEGLGCTVRLLGFAADEGHHEFDVLAGWHVDRLVGLLLDPDGRARREVRLPPVASRTSTRSDVDAGPHAQAWALLGLTAAASRWGRFVLPARRAGLWWLEHFGTRVPAVPLKDSAGAVDTSAAVVAAAGLLELFQVTGDRQWDTAARALVDDVVGRYLDGGILRDGWYEPGSPTRSRGEVVRGSFFLTAVLMVLTGRIRRPLW
ncbi:hypothetical protein ACN28G_14385 [Micromonospora sp. WMMA1923]|uniref:hypothetical protein n=1 Tax=Micromonospora sp. WMMA1923 TaxID=3404125 RepID=UPI003B92C628